MCVLCVMCDAGCSRGGARSLDPAFVQGGGRSQSSQHVQDAGQMCQMCQMCPMCCFHYVHIFPFEKEGEFLSMAFNTPSPADL